MVEVRDTSREAWEVLNLGELQKNAYRVIYEAGVSGLTSSEVSIILGDGRQYHQRPGELEKLGHIVDSQVRRANPSGRQAIVWIAKCYAPWSQLEMQL